MSLIRYTLSTERTGKQAASSSGAYLNDLMTPFTRASFREFDERIYGWETGSGIRLLLQFDMPGTLGRALSQEVRAVAHFLVDQLPDEGLPELLESLDDLIEFYAITPPREQRPLLGLGGVVAVRDSGASTRPTVTLEDAQD